MPFRFVPFRGIMQTHFYYGREAQLKFHALHKRPNETCYLARPYLECMVVGKKDPQW